MFDFAQGLKLAHKGVGVTQQIPSLVLICDAKTWSLENRNKTVSDTGLSLCTDWVLDFVQEMGDLKLTLKGVGVTPKNLFLSLDLWCKDLVPQKREDKTILDSGLSLCADWVFDFA